MMDAIARQEFPVDASPCGKLKVICELVVMFVCPLSARFPLYISHLLAISIGCKAHAHGESPLSHPLPPFHCCMH